MPKGNFTEHGPHKRAWGDLHGDDQGRAVPFSQVWNTFGNATGSSVSIPAGAGNHLVVAARPERRYLSISHSTPTGTVNFWLGLGHPAGLNSGLGPLTDFGSTAVMSGIVGVYTGPIYARHDGGGPALLSWEEGW